MLIGYARVSTADQNLDAQRDALTEAECERLYPGIVVVVGRLGHWVRRGG